jgi:CHAT domain-containing protein
MPPFVPARSCLKTEELADFIEGRLDPSARHEVTEHMTNCVDCRSRIAAARSSAATGAGDHRDARFNPAAIGSTILAVAALVLLLYAPLHRRISRNETTDAIESLRAAAERQSKRAIAPRLTGGFAHRPLLVSRGKDDAGPTDLTMFQMASGASLAASAAAAHPSIANLRTLGVALLLHNRPSEAVVQLEKALRSETRLKDPVRGIAAARDAALLSDLAAAYYERGRSLRQGRDTVAAVEAATAAWILQRTPEIAWNRALALEALGLRDDAESAWSDYLRLDPKSPWAGEAGTHLAALREATDVQRWEQQKKRIDSGELNAEAIAHVAAQYPQYARALAEDDLLPAWGAATLARDPSAARHLEIAAAVASGVAANGDLLLRESVETIRTAPPKRFHALADGHSAYGKGRALADAGRHGDARMAFVSAADALAGAGSPFEGFARFQMAVCSYLRNDYPDTVRLLDAVSSSLPERKYRALAGRIGWVRGLADEQLGHPTRAFERYRDALQTFSALGERDNEAALLTLIAETLHRSGEDDAAIDHHLRSVATIARTGSSKRRHQVLFEAAFALLEQRRLFTAEILLDRVLITDLEARVPTGACVTLVWRGVVHSMRGNRERSEADLRQAEQRCAAIPDPHVRERIMANFTLAAVAARETAKPRPAVETTRAIAFFDATRSRLWLPQLLSERAAAYRADGRLTLAEHDLRRGIEEVEAAEAQARYTSSITGEAVQSLYESMIGICVEQRRFGDALEYADRASRRTNSALFGRIDAPGRIPSVSPGSSGVAARLQAVLPPGVVVANFFQLPDRLLVWTIRNNGVRFHAVEVTAESFRELADHFSADPEGSAAWPDRAAAATVSKTVLDGWIEDVRENETIIFAGESAVRVLPLAALTHPARGGFLIEHVAIATATTLAQLVSAFETDAGRRFASRPFFVAASAPNPEAFRDLAPLPYTEREIGATANLYGSAALAGTAATRQAFLDRAGAATLVHFAGHAVVNARAPLFSALIFSESTAGGGEETLYMHEVSPATFPAARLVVLTACRTAEQLRPNVSFAAALVEQQVPSVVSSIWDADDRAAAMLGTQFHVALRRGASRAAALREAQINMLRNRDLSISAPAAWAGFQLLGAVGPLQE